MLRADSKQSVSRSHYCDLAENRSQNLTINETDRLNQPGGGNANSPIDFHVLPLFTLHFQSDGVLPASRSTHKALKALSSCAHAYTCACVPQHLYMTLGI